MKKGEYWIKKNLERMLAEAEIRKFNRIAKEKEKNKIK